MTSVSQFDIDALALIRKSVDYHLKRGVSKYAVVRASFLEIAPQVHLGVRQFLEPQHTLHTLDLTDTYSPTFVGDICAKNHNIQNDFYDAVFMTEVIEHVLNPFIAITEILRVLKPGGVLFTSSPFNFRIHGPLPDCWRITEHGWRILLSDFVDVVIEEEVSFDRFLMPIHYRVTARKPIQM